MDNGFGRSSVVVVGGWISGTGKLGDGALSGSRKSTQLLNEGIASVVRVICGGRVAVLYDSFSSVLN